MEVAVEEGLTLMEVALVEGGGIGGGGGGTDVVRSAVGRAAT